MTPEDKFIKHVKEECKKHGVRLRLAKTKRVRSGGYVSGYFDDEEPSLVVAMGNPNWVEILLHEFCHMQQWLEDSDIWRNSIVSTGEDAWTVMSRHLRGEEIKQSLLDEAYGMVIRCERDCDMRAVRMMKKFRLPIDTKEYIRQSNSYHYFYHAVKKTGKWYGKIPIYKNPDVVALCPDTFRAQTDKTCPEHIMNAILEHMKGKCRFHY